MSMPMMTPQQMQLQMIMMQQQNLEQAKVLLIQQQQAAAAKVAANTNANKSANASTNANACANATHGHAAPSKDEGDKDDKGGEAEGELTLEEYTASLEEYIQKEVGHITFKDDDDNVVPEDHFVESLKQQQQPQDRRSQLQKQSSDSKSSKSGNSWVKSFHSIDEDEVGTLDMEASFMSGSLGGSAFHHVRVAGFGNRRDAAAG